MNTFLYDSKIVCPVCEREFTYTRVRTSHLRVLERGKDFYTKYDGIEPFFTIQLYVQIVVMLL